MTKVSQLLAKNNNGNKHENEQGVCSGPNDDKYSAGGMGKKDVNMTKLLAKIQGTTSDFRSSVRRKQNLRIPWNQNFIINKSEKGFYCTLRLG